MTKTSLLKGILVVVAIVLGRAVSAQSTHYDLTDDQYAQVTARSAQLWSGVQTQKAIYRAPPPNWKVASDDAGMVLASFPCTPRRSANAKAVLVLCDDVGGHTFGLSVMKNSFDSTQASSRDPVFAAFEYTIENGHLSKVAPSQFTPLRRITYDGFMGRESRETGGDYEEYVRLIAMPDYLVVLLVSGKKGSFSDLRQTFYDGVSIHGK